MPADLQDLAESVVKRALERGATDVECTVSEGSEFGANVRMREIEQLKEAGSRGAGVRVFVGKRTGSATTSDLTQDGIGRMLAAALDNAAVTSDDPLAGLPDVSELGSLAADLQLYDESVANLATPWKIEQAKLAESAALDADPRIANSEGGSFDSHLSARYFANSRGFAGGYRRSSCSLSVVPVAKDGDHMERDYWYSAARNASRLEAPEFVGKEAARRALQRLGSRKIATQKAPILFEPRTARSLLASIFEAVSGDSVYRGASFLAGKVGTQVASEQLTVVDDPTIPGLFGSWPFDDEGVPARRKVVIDRGVLKTYLHNTYTARKMSEKTTGNAGRSLAGNPWVDQGNFYIEAGTKPVAEIIQGLRTGLLVTELMGQGVNVVNGDYSRGAAGLWIENGEVAYPVSGITIASNLKQMLMNIETIGSDLEFRGSTASPTLLIQEMTISGS